jgi:hypothetical protein
MKTKNLIFSGLLVITLIGAGCKQKDSQAPAAAGGGGGGSGAPTLNRYITSCTTISDTYNANSKRVNLIFTGSTYSYSQFYFLDGACATPAFTFSTTGTFSIGSATASPSGGYLINFIPTTNYVTVYDIVDGSNSDTGFEFISHCGTHWTAAQKTYNASNSGLICGGGVFGLVPKNTTLYNVFVLSGGVLGLGAVTESNPGVSISSGVATSTSIDIPAY